LRRYHAVTQSGRGGGDISREERILKISEALSYLSTLRYAAQKMVVLGVSPENLVFTSSGNYLNNNCTSGVNCLFSDEGGGAIALSPDPSICEAGQTGEWGIDTISYGYAMEDVGTAAADISIWLWTNEEMCRAYNVALGHSSTIQDDTTAGSVNNRLPR